MAYEFKNLGTVEKLNEVPENANAIVEVDGALKRVPGGALGGSSGGDAFDFMIADTSLGLGAGIVNASPSDFQFTKGDAMSLYDMIAAGQIPRVCFYAQANTSYGPMYACSIPNRIGTSFGSGGPAVIFEFVEYSTYTESLTCVQIILAAEYGEFFKNTFMGGEPE